VMAVAPWVLSCEPTELRKLLPRLKLASYPVEQPNYVRRPKVALRRERVRRERVEDTRKRVPHRERV